MKILVISHTYTASINREKWKILARLYPNVSLKVVFPKTWQDVLFRLEAEDAGRESLENCDFIPLNAFKTGNEVLYGYYPWALIKVLRSFKPDIIHVEQGDNAFSYFQAILFSRIFCRKATPIFFTWINWISKRTWKYKLFWGFIEKFNLFFSKGAFVGNWEAGKILMKKGFLNPVKVLPQLGVDLKFFKPDTNKIRKALAFVGRLVDEKGVFLLAKAFNRLAQDFFGWKLLFVGDGTAKNGLKKYVDDLGLTSRVEFCESVDHFFVRDILQKIDILVLPSYDTWKWKEQFGHVIIEAMACRVPVVGSDGGEIPNVIGDAGLIFKQRDSIDLANKLKMLMSNEELRSELAQKGYERVKEYYSHEAIAKQTYEFWKEFV